MSDQIPWAAALNFRNELLTHIICGTAPHGTPGRRELLLEREALNFGPRPQKCEGSFGPCEATEGLEWESSDTAYLEDPWNGEGPQLPKRNLSLLLCRRCAAAHHQHWEEMWNEYNSTRF
jgi:hypothetical protein